MENSLNRVIDDLQGWQQMEKKWKDLFGSQIVNQRYFVKERLRELQNIPMKYIGQGRTMSAEEKSAIKIVKGEINRMQKVIYPNSIVRGIKKVLKSIKELGTRVNGQSSEEINWKPSIGAIRYQNKPKTDQTEQDKTKAVAHQITQNKGPKKDNEGPNRDIRKSERMDNDNEPLLVKLKTGNGKGLRH